MANPDHIAQLMKGVGAWNTWRDENPTIVPDLSGEEAEAQNKAKDEEIEALRAQIAAMDGKPRPPRPDLN